MLYQKLKELLEEWEKYDSLKTILPSHILRKERRSIATAIKVEVEEMKRKNEYHKVSKEEKEKIKKIIDLLEKDDFD